MNCYFLKTPHPFFKTLDKKFFVPYYYVIGYQPATYYDNECHSRTRDTPRR